MKKREKRFHIFYAAAMTLLMWRRDWRPDAVARCAHSQGHALLLMLVVADTLFFFVLFFVFLMTSRDHPGNSKKYDLFSIG